MIFFKVLRTVVLLVTNYLAFSLAMISAGFSIMALTAAAMAEVLKLDQVRDGDPFGSDRVWFHTAISKVSYLTSRLLDVV